MSLLNTAIAKMQAKRQIRMDAAINFDKPSVAILAQPTSINQSTGVLIATAPDGGEIQYSAGNFRPQSAVISVVAAKNSLIAFGDWL